MLLGISVQDGSYLEIGEHNSSWAIVAGGRTIIYNLNIITSLLKSRSLYQKPLLNIFVTSK